MTITAQTAKTGPYNGNGSTTTFSYTFKVSSAAHLVVTVLGTDGSTESVKVLNTDYTVTGVGSPSGGTIVMGTAPVTGEKLTITRNVTLDQEVDLQNRGAVNPETLEESLDKLTQISQDQQEQLDRSLKVDLFEQADLDQLTLNVNALAAIAPNISTVAGISADVTAVAADATDIGVVSANITNVNTVAGISSDVTAVVADEADIGIVATDLTGANTVGTVAGISGNVTTVAGISADVTAVAADATDIGTVSANITNVNTVAGISGNVTTVAGISADVTAVAADATDIGTVSANITNVNTVAGISGNVTTVAGISANVTAVAADATDIGTVSANITNVNTVAGISADVTTVAADGTDIGTVATNIANVNTVAGISGNVTTVAGISANVTAVAGDAADIGTVATNITNVNTVAGISGNVTTVAGISADVTAVAGDATDIGTVSANITNVNTVAGISAAVTTVAADGTDIGAVAANSTNINTVAAISGNVTTVANVSADVTTVATNIAAIIAAPAEASAAAVSAGNAATSASNASTSESNAASSAAAAAASYDSFDDRYLGPKSSAPTLDNDGNALLVGALYFDTVLNEMRGWTGSAWVSTATTFNSANANITGGNINGTVIGGSTPAAISGTTGQFGTSLNVDGTVTADGLTVVGSGNITKTSAAAASMPLVIQNESSTTASAVELGFENTTAAGRTTSLTKIGAVRVNTPFAGDSDVYINTQTNGASARRALFSTNGDISFYEDTGTTPKFFWDASAESLGIGTTTPSSALTVRSPDATIRLEDSDLPSGAFGLLRAFDGGMTFEADASNVQSQSSIRFAVDGGERLRITSTGNVGIGTSSPVANVHVHGGAADATLKLTANITGQTSSDGFDIAVSQSSGDAILQNRENTNMRFFTNNTERMRINASGNVGIGSTTPNNNLHVKTSADGGGVTLQRNSTTAGTFSQLSFLLTDADVGTPTAWMRGIRGSSVSLSDLAFGTSNTERMRINASGNVGIGTSSPDERLDVNGTVKANRFITNNLGNFTVPANDTLVIFVPLQSGFRTAHMVYVAGGADGFDRPSLCSALIQVYNNPDRASRVSLGGFRIEITSVSHTSGGVNMTVTNSDFLSHTIAVSSMRVL